MFGSNRAEIGDLKVRLTQLELKIEDVQRTFRKLETEWLESLSKFDSIMKRTYRATQYPQPNATKIDGPVEQPLTPETIQQLYGGPPRG